MQCDLNSFVLPERLLCKDVDMLLSFRTAKVYISSICHYFAVCFLLPLLILKCQRSAGRCTNVF